MGVTGRGFPNLACDGCDTLLAAYTDGCGCWRETRFDPALVRAEHATERPGPAYRPAADAQTHPGGRSWTVDEGHLSFAATNDSRWDFEIVACAATLLAGTGGGPIVTVGKAIEPLAALTADGIRAWHQKIEVHALDGLRRAGAAAMARLFGPADGVGGAPISLWTLGDLAASGSESVSASKADAARDLGDAARRLGEQAAAQGVSVPRFRLFVVAPRAEETRYPPAEELDSDPDSESRRPADGAIRRVALDPEIWTMLHRMNAEARQPLSRTRWRGGNLAAEVYRDDPPPRSVVPPDRPGIRPRIQPIHALGPAPGPEPPARANRALAGGLDPPPPFAGRLSRDSHRLTAQALPARRFLSPAGRIAVGCGGGGRGWFPRPSPAFRPLRGRPTGVRWPG